MQSKTVNIKKNGNLVYITFPKFVESGMVKHAFTTRLGGVSKGYFGSMNMSFNRNDDEKSVRKNYEIICDEIGINTDNLVFSQQTHTDNLLTVTTKDRGTGFSKPPFCDIDGLVTNQKNVALVTQYADCTPLIFCDTKKGVIAASHSGWRGTVKKIGQKTVEKMVSEFSCNPNDIIAGIGPCINKCCYEVDETVFSEFQKAKFDTESIFVKKPNGKYMLDLITANKNILIESGISESNIDVADICTFCNSSEMFSHRAQGVKRGNMAMIIELK